MSGALRGDDREYSGYRRPGLRLSEALDPRLQTLRDPNGIAEFASSLLRFDLAHAVVLAECEVISRAHAAAIADVLRRIRLTHGVFEDTGRTWTVTGGETEAIRALGMEIGGRLHAGRSSIDLERTAHRMRLRAALLDVSDHLNAYRRALLSIAIEHLTTVMPVHIRGHAAQPTTLAHHLHSFACAAERDAQRLDAAYARVNVSPAGGAASTGTRFNVDRERLGNLLGFDAVSRNTRDSSFNYDHISECAVALTFIAANLGEFGSQIIEWMADSLSFVRLADRFSDTSSIMTEWRLPSAADVLTALRSQAEGRAVTSYAAGDVVALATRTMKALDLASAVVESLIVRPDLMLQAFDGSWALASDLAAVIAQERGLPWRVAHHIVGIAVRLAEDSPTRDALPVAELLDQAAVLFMGKPLALSQETLSRGLDPHEAVATRRVTGAPRPEEMRVQISHSIGILQNDERRCADRAQRLHAADVMLDSALDELARATK